MAAIDDVVTRSEVGFDGNSYTTAVSNDKLTNDDFLKLMLEEMKQQDPTKPMDSAALMDSQLKMSSIQANQDMSKSMLAMQASYASSALSSASNMIGHQVKDGSVNAKGDDKVYAVDTVENRDGVLYLKAKEYVGVKDALKLVDEDTETYLDYDVNGFILKDGANISEVISEDEDGNQITTTVRVSLDGNKRFEYNDDNSLKLLDSDGVVITNEDIKAKYQFASTFPLYADEFSTIALNSVVEVK